VKRRLRALLDTLIRLLLVLGLAVSPLAQPLAMAALMTPAAPQAQADSGCPHHAKAAQPKPGDCCFKPGSACHCAMAAALPTAALPAPATGLSDHPVSAPRLTVSRLAAPEPPPPRP
jgi:hypothetical protein